MIIEFKDIDGNYKKKNVILSHSALKLISCPLAFARKYLFTREPSPKVFIENLQFGSLIHDCFEYILNQKRMYGENPTLDQWWTWLQRNSHNFTIEKIYEAKHIVSGFVEEFAILDPSFITGVEDKICISTKLVDGKWEYDPHVDWDPEDKKFDENNPNALARGVIDLHMMKGDTVKVIDHKSQHNIMPSDELRLDSQLTMYCWMLIIKYPQLKRFLCGRYYARHRFLHMSERTVEDLRFFHRLLMNRVKFIQECESWEPIPSSFCSYCPTAIDCPKQMGYKNDLKRPAVISPEMAIEYGNQLYVLTKNIKDIKKKLQIWIGEHGPVPIGENREWRWNTSVSITYPSSFKERIISENDLNRDVYMDTKTFNKFLDKNPEIKKLGEKIAIQKIRNEFKDCVKDKISFDDAFSY